MAYGKKHGSIMTAGIIHVNNLTPGSDVHVTSPTHEGATRGGLGGVEHAHVVHAGDEQPPGL